jgi:integrase
MNATRTELEKLQRTHIANLVKLQEQIAEGRSPVLPDGKAELFHWHPRIPAFGLRQYASGRGVWVLQYRTKDGQKRTKTIGNAAVLTLKYAEKVALDVSREVAAGNDPVGDQKKQRERARRTVGALCEEYFDEMSRSRKLSPLTLRGYRNVCKNHLGELRNMQDVELWQNQNAIVMRLREIAQLSERIETGKTKAKRNKARKIVGGPRVAGQFSSALQSAYKWAMGRYPDDIKVNPVNGIWKPEIPAAGSSARCLSFEELGAIWRACETMAAAPPRYLGRYLEAPVPANSVRDPRTWLPLQAAARQCGLHMHTLHDAIYDGRLKAIRRGALPEEKRRDKRWGWHRRDGYLVSQEELNRFTGVRLHRMRSPHAEVSTIVRLLMLLGSRYSEIGGLRWNELGEFDAANKFTSSTPPQALFIREGIQPDGRRTKTKKSLVLYLPQAARNIIATVPQRPGCDLLFGAGVDRRGLINNDRLKKAIDRTIAASDGAPLAPWRIHDLRHSFTTHLKETMKIAPHIVEAMTNHLAESDRRSLPAMAGNYTHAKYMDQQQPALEAWANKVLQAAHPDKVQVASNVSPLFDRSA